MLSKITIQNFALIQHLSVSLENGLQVITGETGAGKSIILGALRLILGERADSKSISDPEKKSVVEAEFKITSSYLPFFEENDLDFEENTIIRREILPSGKSRAFINDIPVTLDVLKELSSKLIDIHSQFETSNLFSEEYQFKIIDGLSENKEIISDYQKKFVSYQNLKRELLSLENQLAERNKESDYQSFLLSELQEFNLDNINLEELKNKVNVGEHAELILENLGQISGRFQQEVFTSQLNKINSLLLKHQVSDIEELIVIREQLSTQQKNSENLEKDIEETKNQLNTIQQDLDNLAKILFENRQKTIPIFKEKTEELLARLGLEKAKIEVEFTENQDFNKFGKEHIQLLFQANSGFPLKPIQSAISGGERSRVMLSIKKIMAENAELPTLILDEIDSGVSGKTADEIGKVMQDMAKNMQLIVITHHAQVAAKGNSHYKVVKQDVDGKTQSNIIPLGEKERLHEIAQILSGSTITDAALQQAEELMKN